MVKIANFTQYIRIVQIQIYSPLFQVPSSCSCLSPLMKMNDQQFALYIGAVAAVDRTAAAVVALAGQGRSTSSSVC